MSMNLQTVVRINELHLRWSVGGPRRLVLTKEGDLTLLDTGGGAIMARVFEII